VNGAPDQDGLGGLIDAVLDGKQLVDPHVHEEKVGPLGGRQYGEIVPVGWLPNNTLYRLDHPDVLS